MQDIRNMTPRELGRGLMRGDARELKAGYSWQNAHGAVLRLRGLESSSAEAGELGLYLLGFADGMAGRGNRYAGADALPYKEGREDGLIEPRELILPVMPDLSGEREGRRDQ